jgi:cell division septum initiation protein DivIVA
MNLEDRLSEEQKQQLHEIRSRLKRVQEDDKAKGIVGVGRQQFLDETEVSVEEYGAGMILPATN